MDEGRKRVLGIMAAILAARKLARTRTQRTGHNLRDLGCCAVG
jgi:hypothetical protein